jgi:YVTN family beta-propeller protein
MWVKFMINKHKLYSLTLISAAVILILTSIAGAAPFAYVTNEGGDTVSVIDTSTNTVTATVPTGSFPFGIAITPNGAYAYVTSFVSYSVFVINTSTNTVTAAIVVPGFYVYGIAITPDGTKVYVTNDNSVTVIDTSTNSFIATIDGFNGASGVAVTPEWNTSIRSE